MGVQNFFQFGGPQSITFPDNTQRIVIVGATGSGKTHAGLWHLSRRNYDERPWVVYDFKYDEFINSIPGTYHLDVDAPPPDHPGLYIVHPNGEDDDEAVEAQMRAIWKEEEIGVFVDEGYMIDSKNKAFRLLLTQGRSKEIPMIVCSQRPVWMDRFVFSESEYKQVFRLSHSEDMKKMADSVPGILESERLYGRLEKRWSYYYNGIDDKLNRLQPLPDQAAIRRIFEAKLSRLRKVV